MRCTTLLAVIGAACLGAATPIDRHQKAVKILSKFEAGTVPDAALWAKRAQPEQHVDHFMGAVMKKRDTAEPDNAQGYQMWTKRDVQPEPDNSQGYNMWTKRDVQPEPDNSQGYNMWTKRDGEPEPDNAQGYQMWTKRDVQPEPDNSQGYNMWTKRTENE